jgi:hypothetical protein
LSEIGAPNHDEIVQRLNDGSISTIHSCGFLFWDGLVRSKALQNADRQGSIDFLIELQEHQADLIAVGEEPAAAGMTNLFQQALGAQLPEVITEGGEFVRKNIINEVNKNHAALLSWTKFTAASSLIMMVLGVVLLLLFGVENILLLR